MVKMMTVSSTTQWRKIVDSRIACDAYEINQYGEIRDVETGETIPPREYYGKLYVSLFEKNKINKAIFRADRLLATAFIPCQYDTEKLWLYHIDGDCMNLSLDNMEWRLPGYMKFEDALKRFEFIRTHLDLDAREMTDEFYRLYHEKLTKRVIYEVLRKKNHNILIMGYTFEDFLPVKPVVRITKEIAREICCVIIECDGDEKKILTTMDERYPYIKESSILSILYKRTFLDISDDYFDIKHCGFIPLVTKEELL